MAKIPEHSRLYMAPPVVPPCQAVPPTALLSHLFLLATEIAESSMESVVVARRSCRRAIRLASLVSVFLEEVRDHLHHHQHNATTVFGSSAVVTGMVELHVVFQRVRRLFHECGRRGSGGRVWSLMRSEGLAEEFRSAMISMATGVNLLLMMVMGDDEFREFSEEAREYGRLASKQAAEGGNVRVDPEDARAANDIRRIIAGLEKGIHPDRETMMTVFQRLEISSWSDCDEEVSFLEEEIGFATSDDDISLLSSLTALMLYSRSLLFGVIDVKTDVDDESEHYAVGGGVGSWTGTGSKELKCLDAEDFRCPVSLELMKDPVTICTGQTYERASIVRWLKSGKRTCPVTGKSLTTTKFVPNLALKSVIQKLCHHNDKHLSSSADRRRSIDKTSSSLPGSPAAAQAMRMLASFLVSELSSGSHEERSKALREIRLVERASVFNRLCLVEAGGVPWLLHFLASWDPVIQENSIAAVLDLVKHTKARKVVFDSGGLVHIIEVLTHGLSVDARQKSAAALFYLSSIDECRRAIGESPGAIPGLVRMLNCSDTPRGKRIAMTALFGLLLFPGNHRRVLDADAVPHLVAVLSSRKSEDLASDSLSVLNSLADEGLDGSNAILRLPSSIPALVQTLRCSTSVSTKEQCVSLLLSLFRNAGGKASIDLNRFPHLMPSLYSLLTEGSPRAAKTASSLISVLLRERTDLQPNASSNSPPLHHRELRVR